MPKITIDPVTRIEGHAKITIHVGEDGAVERAQFHVTQVRGFEAFTKGRPYYEMPGITARICGICPISHLLASSKACDAIMAVRIPPAGAMLREAIHCGQIVQSHALSFFHLSGPDLLLGFDSDPVARNVLGLAAKHPAIAKDGIALRKFGQRVIERLAGERIHPPGIVPGGVATPLEVATRDAILAEMPEAFAITRRAFALFKGVVDSFPAEIENFGKMQTMYAGLVGPNGELRLYDGRIRFKNANGTIAAECDGDRYAQYIGEASAPGFVPKGPVLQTGRLPRGHLSRRSARAIKRGGLLRHTRSRRRAERIPPAFRADRGKLVPLPLRPADRSALRPGAAQSAAGNAGDPEPPRTRTRRGQRAGRHRRGRSASRNSDPSLQGGRERRHHAGPT